MTRTQLVRWLPWLGALSLVALITFPMLDRPSMDRGEASRGDDGTGAIGARTEISPTATSVQSIRNAAQPPAPLNESNGAASNRSVASRGADNGSANSDDVIIKPIPIPAEFRAFIEGNQELAAFHARLERESEDAAWASRVERVLEDHFNQAIDPSSYRLLSIECRSAACEVLAVGYGDDALRGWMDAAKKLIDSGVVEELFPKPGHAGCGGGDAGPGVFLLNCTFERVDSALADATSVKLSLDAPYADGVAVERVEVPESLVPLIETNAQVYDLHRRLEREPTDLSWSNYIEPLLADYLTNLDGAQAIDIVGIDCRTSLCEVQLVSNDDAAFISLVASMPEFQQQSWHDLTTAGMNGNDIEDGGTGLVWIMERSAD